MFWTAICDLRTICDDRRGCCRNRLARIMFWNRYHRHCDAIPSAPYAIGSIYDWIWNWHDIMGVWFGNDLR